MYMRISNSESSYTHYMLSLKGTPPPSRMEMLNNTLRTEFFTKSDVFERFGTNSSYISPYTDSYIYYDTFLLFEGL